jgi:hypothetical protein
MATVPVDGMMGAEAEEQRTESAISSRRPEAPVPGQQHPGEREPVVRRAGQAAVAQREIRRARP